MKTTIHYPFGMLNIKATVRAKLVFKAELETGFCSRNIINLCKGMDAIKAIPYIERIEQSSHSHYGLCFCMLLEQAQKMEDNETLDKVRTLLLEKERIYSHLMYLHRMFELAGCVVVKNMAESAINTCLDELEEITGSRTYSVSHSPNNLNYIFSVGNIIYSELINKDIKEALNKMKELIQHSFSIKSQYENLCKIETSVDKITGPFSWSHTNGFDLRINEPYLCYGDKEISAILSKNQILDSSFAYGRIMCLIEDANCSCNIIEELLGTIKDSPRTKSNQSLNLNEGKYSQSIEGPRGKIDMEVEIEKDNKIKSLKISSPSEKNTKMATEALKHSPADELQQSFESLYISVMEIDC